MAAKTEQERRQSRAASKRRRRKQNRLFALVLAVLALALIVCLILWVRSCAGPNGTGDVSDDTSTTTTTASTTMTPVELPTIPLTGTTTTAPSNPSAQYVDGHYVQPEGGDWNLLLVNNWNPLTEAEVNAIPLAAYNDAWDFDERALPYLDQMLEDANAAGCNLWGQSLFRPYSLQAALFDDQVAELMAAGDYTRQAAEAEAATIVARPGCSEHNTGLAVDFECADFPDLDEGFKDTYDYEWLMAHCAEYGFILRFPKDKEALTGVIYEPWHYRYVGVEAATEIMSRGLCLEEYLEEKGL